MYVLQLFNYNLNFTKENLEILITNFFNYRLFYLLITINRHLSIHYNKILYFLPKMYK